MKYFEQSPKQYLLALRMTRARQLLQGQHLSIKQVAHSLGYFDVSYFSNRFKKHFGVAPGAVQRNANYSESASAIGSEA
ncbi:AraC family transcriptional regulator [Vibrio sp. EJY3]|nr:AraC family transcriptional regulator [Vibrio sp. EJY3]